MRSTKAFVSIESASRLVSLWGVVLQVTFALFVLRTDFGLTFFSGVNEGANKLIGFAQTGLSMVFGDLVSKYPLAFSALPAIIFFGALMSVLYHLRIMQAIVWVFDVAMRRCSFGHMSTA